MLQPSSEFYMIAAIPPCTIRRLRWREFAHRQLDDYQGGVEGVPIADVYNPTMLYPASTKMFSPVTPDDRSLTR